MLTQELVENPVLEEGDQEYEDEKTQEEKSEAEEEPEQSEDESASMDEIDFEAFFSDVMDGSTGPSMTDVREAPPLENTLSRDPDLYDHLLWQLHMTDVSPRQREIAEIIIGNLDPDGFWWRALRRSWRSQTLRSGSVATTTRSRTARTK